MARSTPISRSRSSSIASSAPTTPRIATTPASSRSTRVTEKVRSKISIDAASSSVPERTLTISPSGTVARRLAIVASTSAPGARNRPSALIRSSPQFRSHVSRASIAQPWSDE
jgi:hypothetical protein